MAGLGRIDPKQASDCFEKSLKQEARSTEAIFGLEAAEHRSRLLRRTEAIGASKKFWPFRFVCFRLLPLKKKGKYSHGRKIPDTKKIIVIIQDLPVGLCINYDILCRNWLLIKWATSWYLNGIPRSLAEPGSVVTTNFLLTDHTSIDRSSTKFYESGVKFWWASKLVTITHITAYDTALIKWASRFIQIRPRFDHRWQIIRKLTDQAPNFP